MLRDKQPTEVVGHEEVKSCDGYCGSRRLCVTGVALAAGVVNGLGMIILGLLAGSYNFGIPMVELISSIYKGYAPGLHGALWGGLWGFVDAFVAGLVFALIYNGISFCCHCLCKACKFKKLEKHKVIK
jgi:hypothetical protein